MRLKERVAIVTGAARGIGRAIASRFAREGARVIVDDINQEKGLAVVEEIRAADGEALFVRADVSQEEEVNNLVGQAVEAFGRLDILVNNAVCDSLSVLQNVWEPNFNVTLKGAWLCCQAAIPRMAEAGGGSIINISSVNALMGLGTEHVYSAAKAGMVSFTRCLAVQHGRDGIRVNCICPGSIQTEIWDELLKTRPQIWDELVRWYPLGRLGRPEDIANAALFLASDEASFATGAIFVIDGGLTAGFTGWPI